MRSLIKTISLKITLTLSVCALTISLAAPVAIALIQPSDHGQTHAKKCEKCERGKDGKMVCKPVPCP